ncbi:response regulator transcription factor [bacterium]|nr:response regulator transcription factor [bacterium]
MKQVTVILADDHKLFRVGLKQLLEKSDDVRVIAEAATGLEACDLVLRHKPDILILDVSMPDLNGIEAARRISECSPDTRIIILSMHSDRRYVTEALTSGARGYLVKDCAPDDLLVAIHKVMQGEYFLSPSLTAQLIEQFVNRRGLDPTGPFSVLSAREREVLQLLAEGRSTKEIADKLALSGKTVETHRQHVMEKLNLHTVAELTRYAIKEGLTPLD